MKVVIADTSPLNYLVLIDSVDILHRLYGTIVVPEEVLSELLDPGTPAKVMQWIHNCPEWLSIHAASNTRDAALSQLDPGERAAILLAQQYGRDALLLIDDAAGRIEASRRSIANVGTLGVLRAAARRKLLDLPSALYRLLDTNFRVSEQLVTDLITEDRIRRSGPPG
jgi:predicted nucleic acid-binding protein